jgi:hypothetical protein
VTSLPYAVTAHVGGLVHRVEDGVVTYFLAMGEETTRVWRDPADWRHDHTKTLRVRQALQAARNRARAAQQPVRIVLQASDGRVLYETPVVQACGDIGVPRPVDEEPTRPLRAMRSSAITTR